MKLFALNATREFGERVAAGARLHTHAAENRRESAAVAARYGKENVAALADLGLLGADAALAHCVWLSDGDLQRLRELLDWMREGGAV